MAGQILVVSDGTLMPGDAVTDTIGRAGVLATLVRDTNQALTRLRADPRPVVLDAAMPGAEAFVGRVRSEGALAGCPLLTLVPHASDAAFAEALGWGVDEVVPANALHALGPLARTLASNDIAARPPATRGTVLVASDEARDRLARARSLRNAGFGVEFATSADETSAKLAQGGLVFAVIGASLHPDGVRWLARMLAADTVPCPVVAVVGSHEVDRFTAELPHGARARVLARHDPPEDALFLGNEMVRVDLSEGRASERLLHATVCAFRWVGQEQPSYGMTYNVSAEGLYVRTVLAPPSGTALWLELRPPTASAIVQLEARVVWARRFGTSGGATAPAGFGVRIEDATARSREGWQAGYQQLAASRTHAS